MEMHLFSEAMSNFHVTRVKSHPARASHPEVVWRPVPGRVRARQAERCGDRAHPPPRQAPPHMRWSWSGLVQVIMAALLIGIGDKPIIACSRTAASPHIRSARGRPHHDPSSSRASARKSATILFGGLFQPGGTCGRPSPGSWSGPLRVGRSRRTD